MVAIKINEPELMCIGLFRIALSEKGKENRLEAIRVIKSEVVSIGLNSFPLNKPKPGGGSYHPDFVKFVAEKSFERYEAAHAFNAIAHRYTQKNERQLNIAEQIGKMVWLSIKDRRFQGLHSRGGLLEQVRQVAKQQNIRGAQDIDTLRTIWNEYRGVVHLGMAMNTCENQPELNINILHLAEQYRKELSLNCPSGTQKPYVTPNDQIYFLYISGA